MTGISDEQFTEFCRGWLKDKKYYMTDLFNESASFPYPIRRYLGWRAKNILVEKDGLIDIKSKDFDFWKELSKFVDETPLLPLTILACLSILLAPLMLLALTFEVICTAAVLPSIWKYMSVWRVNTPDLTLAIMMGSRYFTIQEKGSEAS